MLSKIKGYLGNEKLKSENTQLQWTTEQILEYEKCMNDPIYWAEKYFKILTIDYGEQFIKLYDFQKEIINAAFNNNKVIVLTGRQQGKCSRACQLIVVRNKKNGIVYEMPIGVFYEWMKFKNNVKNILESI